MVELITDMSGKAEAMLGVVRFGCVLVKLRCVPFGAEIVKRCLVKSSVGLVQQCGVEVT